jgi:pilus assembly protein Flp/PilA
MNKLPLILVAKLQELTNNEDGQDLVEYALVIALVATGAVLALTNLTASVVSVFNTIGAAMS